MVRSSAVIAIAESTMHAAQRQQLSALYRIVYGVIPLGTRIGQWRLFGAEAETLRGAWRCYGEPVSPRGPVDPSLD